MQTAFNIWKSTQLNYCHRYYCLGVSQKTKVCFPVDQSNDRPFFRLHNKVCGCVASFRNFVAFWTLGILRLTVYGQIKNTQAISLPGTPAKNGFERPTERKLLEFRLSRYLCQCRMNKIMLATTQLLLTLAFITLWFGKLRNSRISFLK